MKKEYIPLVNEFGETRGYRFKQLREMEGMSLRWLSKRTKIPKKKLERMEKDEIPFTQEALIVLSRIFSSTLWI